MGDWHPAYENGRDIRDRSEEFACRVVRLCQQLSAAGDVGRMMVPQLLSCATSVAAMIEEAQAAESKRDFVSKCSIGLKECREAHVRLKVLEQCRIGPADEISWLRHEANELISIVWTIVRNTKRNAGLRNS
jgi:four helix bundle protein